MLELSWSALAILAPLIFLAGFVDAIAGGGGIIAVPAYLAAGLNPAFILGTNKLSSCIGTFVSTANYYRRVHAPIRPFLPYICMALIGSAFGARTVLLIDPKIIKIMLLVAIPFVAVAVYRQKKFGHQDDSQQLSAATIFKRCTVIALVLGFYDGFFGPGVGTFFALCFTRFVRFDLLKATAYAKYMNLASNFAALLTFLIAGKVQILLGVMLGAFSLLGHFIGSRLAIKNGSRVIRPVIVIVLILLFLKVIFDLQRA